ncbi:MAG: aminotransferase class I/II-fold pyridoxal phosphate-dependent enzyme [Lachnospiraceae bacterium]|nr:aminotransferase class I/II-fold pyridoxal phosphate-dependent enzyme [Lachnospiraceae bacterium]
MHGGDIYGNRVDIDFSVNLNPYPRDGGTEERIRRAMEEGTANAVRYPDILQRDVRKALAQANGLVPECVYAGNGASEIIKVITLMTAPKTALLIEPCYSGYENALSTRGGCEIRRAFLSEEKGFGITDDLPDTITNDIDILYIQDPVNPIGKSMDYELMYTILEKANRCYITVLYDRSFYHLSDRSVDDPMPVMDILNRFDNVYIVSSYTKSFALPGIRMGYVMSTEHNINRLIPYFPEWNLSSAATELIKACSDILENSDYLNRSVEYIRKERSFLIREFSGLGFKVYESDTVFILIKGLRGLYEMLLDKGILIRKCEDFNGLDDGFYRIAVRCHEDNVRLIEAVRKVMDELRAYKT